MVPSTDNPADTDALSSPVILGKESSPSIPKAVRRASNRLRDEIMQADSPGTFLGSEEELIRRLEVSRPTFRQVARLLELEQLLTIRRGPGGGFFSRRPSFQGVVHQATVCLVAHKASVEDLMSVGRGLIVEAARQAAASPVPQLRQRLLAYVEATPDRPDSDTQFWIKTAKEFVVELLEVTRNPALMMFIHITQSFAIYQINPRNWMNTDHIGQLRDLHRRLAQAVADGDPEYAEIIADRLNDLMRSWHQM